MVTVVNSPGNNDSGNGMGFLLGVIVLIVFAGLFVVYILPSVQQSMNKGVQVNVPEVKVNIQQPLAPSNP